MTEQLEQGLYYVDRKGDFRKTTIREAIDRYTPVESRPVLKSDLLDIYIDIPLPEIWDIMSDKERYEFIQEAVLGEGKGLSGYLRTQITTKEIMIELFGYSPEKSATGVAESRMIKKHILTKPEWEYKRFRGHGDNPTWGFQRKRVMRW